MRRVALLASIAVVATTVAAAPATGANRNVTNGVIAAGLVATGDWLVWSQQAGPDTSRWRLHVRHRGGNVAKGGVPLRDTGPFDLDAGPGPDGAPTVVYSRAGRIRLVPLRAGGRERTVRTTVPAGARPIWPAIWRDRLAYVVRFADGRRPDRIMVGPVGGPYRRWAAGPTTRRPSYYGPDRTEAAHASGLDLRGDRLVYVWHRGAPGTRELYVDRGPRARTLVSVGEGDLGGEGYDYVGDPLLTATQVLYTVHAANDAVTPASTCNCIRARDLRTGRYRTFLPLAAPFGEAISDVAATRTHVHVIARDSRIVRLSRADWRVTDRSIRGPVAPPPAA